MKRFLTCIGVTATIVIAVAICLIPFSVSAAEPYDNNVIFISDSGTGDGSTAANAMGAVTTHPDYDPTETYPDNYMNTALYQAAEKLGKTGGTIVVCGDVTIGYDESGHSSSSTVDEFRFPDTAQPIKITSVYGGVDYRSKASFISADYTYIILNGETLWENMNIVSDGKRGDRSICCNGNKTVFGEGLTCKISDRLKSEGKTSNAYLLSLAGGSRYYDLTADTDLTVKSGTWYQVLGTTWTVDSSATHTHTGDARITIEGGTVTTTLSANTSTISSSSRHKGNAYITIKGGKIDGQIYCTGKGGFAGTDSTVTVKIEGGQFNLAGRPTPVMAAMSGHSGNAAGKIVIDAINSGTVTDAALNQIITNRPSGAEALYPSAWAVSASMVTAPSCKVAFVGDQPSSEGAAVNVNAVNPVTNETAAMTVKYSDVPAVFTAECDTSSEGVKTVKYKYGNVIYSTADIEVINAPVVTIKGAQIRNNTYSQQLRFWAEYTNKVSEGVKIESLGLISIPSDLLLDRECFDHEHTVQMYDIAPAESTILKNGSITRFAAQAGGTLLQNNFDRDYTARAYVKISYKGETYYRYSEIMERNTYVIANQAITSGLETAETKSWLKTNLIDTSDNYNESYTYNAGKASAARTKVVNYMRSMRDIKWTPTETFIIYNDQTSDGSTSMRGIFYKGKEYTGLPYINFNMSQTESFLDMMPGSYTPLGNDSLTINSNSDWSKLTAEQIAVGNANARSFPGNDCVGALILAWNTVLNNRPEITGMVGTTTVLPGRGYGVIAVGDYEHSNIYSYNTDQMVAANGEQVMAEAYAKLLPGDATIYVRSSSAGNPRHARMVEEKPVVVRNSDGTINLSKSYVVCIDQAGGASSRFIVGSVLTSIQSHKRYFSDLYKEGSLPITIPELATGNVDNEFTYATKLDLANDLPDGKLSGIVKTNRQLISVRAVFSRNGVTVKEIKETPAMRGAKYHISSYDLADMDLSNVQLQSGSEYTLNLYACVSGLDGREVHLVSDYTFTAK